jgi:tRNA-specific 2-thiouridylase
MATVVVGLSGGVDSSTAAALLVDQGYTVIGLTLQHLPPEQANRCCSLEAVVDARRVAKRLGIPHHLLAVEATFAERVIRPFEEAYLAGITPNPCALCNRYVKFGVMWEWAKSQGADFLATGHYARIVPAPGGGLTLARARDQQKDQSYLLYTLTPGDLEHLLFPLGTLTKAQSRAVAAAHQLVTADKAESQELCFVPNNDYRAYLRRHRPDAVRPGVIRDTRGRVVGEHEGVAFYTIGQRRGLGNLREAGPGPHYVVRVDAARNEVVVGDREEVESRRLAVEAVNHPSGHPIREAVRGWVKIRYNMDPKPAWWMPEAGERAVVEFDDPQWAVTPGQVAVLYDQEGRLLAGGRICRPAQAAPA